MHAPPVFDRDFCDRFEQLLAWRRDQRDFLTDPLPEGTLEELVSYASLAPSVGLSEPWRFVAVDDPARRQALRENFQRCNEAALAGFSGERAALYARLKLQGMDQAPVQFALFAENNPGQGHGLGRRTMPETAAYSAVAALHTIWLVARSRGLGLGWISILDPEEVSRLLDVPLHWVFLGYFCLGHPASQDDTPLLQREGWEHRRDSVVLYR
ncbi:MAG TPA: 5,6-dimethylbenzimidazole synthase [Stellaceae bacterium]|nr:5,6-dimethylbenzimidazole synthase [Stellaceae bacterium]